ncbi:Aspartyl/glutamyl-tRNA(Asn/Gln) amidotransferase subunit B [Planctomycetales bacterium 10988]|nr:Aspartyl/glutamyl-tRNA(Asn/Gln) amidotransferase subunit B [Planctomycetales bacterium 10988]
MNATVTDAAYTTIIGLEVHTQLLTKSKLFCGCANRFGEEPNTLTCPVCIGMPGVMPVMNREAFRLAVRTGLALQGKIASFCKWDRKNYYYPDLPKGYQISQFDLPFCEGGHLEVEVEEGQAPSKVRLHRIHLEEDAGKSMHDESMGGRDSLVDLNRTGVPLLEIVTEPDIRSPEEAKAFLTELKLLLVYLGVSDCNMQEGSLRVDANVNLHLPGESGETIATPIVEIKNMNSFRAVERALHHEVVRQWEEWQATGKKKGEVPKQTRGWNDEAGETFAQREKEESSDYRYFPEPDLVPVTMTAEQIATAEAEVGELPQALRTRLQSEYELSAYDADVLVNQGKALVRYYLEVADACGDAKLVSNWLQQDIMRTLKERNITIEELPVSAPMLTELLKKVQSNELPRARARDVFAQMVETEASLEETMDAMGIKQVDAGALRELCQSLVDANPRIVEDVKGGKQQAVGALIGQAKKKDPNVNPGEVRKICLELIQAMGEDS